MVEEYRAMDLWVNLPEHRSVNIGSAIEIGVRTWADQPPSVVAAFPGGQHITLYRGDHVVAEAVQAYLVRRHHIDAGLVDLTVVLAYFEATGRMPDETDPFAEPEVNPFEDDEQAWLDDRAARAELAELAHGR
jgi:hypothetical protein